MKIKTRAFIFLVGTTLFSLLAIGLFLHLFVNYKITFSGSVSPLDIRWAYFIGAGVALFVSIITTAFLSKKVTREIEALKKGVSIIEKGNLNHKASLKANNEIGDLSRSFDRLVLSLTEAQKETEERISKQTQEIAAKNKTLQDQQISLVNVLEDIKKEKIISEKRAEDLKKFKQSVENSSDMTVITDADGIILYANPATTQITGFPIKKVLGQKAGKLWGGYMDEKYYKNFWKIIKKDKQTFTGEITNKRKNGQKYIANFYVTPILDQKKEVKFFVALQRDITRAKEVDRMKTEFISLASHQLRTPLSAMKWFIEMLQDGDVGQMTKEQHHIVKNVYQSNQRMIELVEALLNISRIESGRIIIDPEPTDLKKLVEEVVSEVDNKLKEKKQKLIISI
ncbi:cell wall metabolism sensor histidine kinase WalK, partial [Patescibacteria group bacterium]|nr:cell wall metabolism sensor histidine kinase WalK [Patescibacteria group bacterium]